MTSGDDLLTSSELENARDGEPLSFAEGEELSDEHEDAQDGEDAGEDRGGLHRLEVVCRGRQREMTQRHTRYVSISGFFFSLFVVVVVARRKSSH